ncbi:hypothetical protein BSKO_07102 [Bryopsis sp. KO-2023]|nr:hypothetical protein BSKO_07102 [Bryopsis sp. KO-2023]
MPVETRSRSKRIKKDDSANVTFDPHWDNGASQGLLLDIGPDLLTLITQFLDIDEFCAIRLTHPAIYLQSLQPSTWSPEVGKRMWLKEMIRKMVIRPLRETSIESALNGLARIGAFIAEGKMLASQMVVKRNLAPCVGQGIGELIAGATMGIDINFTWRCEDLDWHPILDWKLKGKDGRNLNVVCSKYYAFVEAYQNLHVCLSKKEMQIDVYVDGELVLDWEIDMNELPFKIVSGSDTGELEHVVRECLGVVGVGPIGLAGMLWLLLREGGLACCCCEPCLARFKEMRSLFDRLGLREERAGLINNCDSRDDKCMVLDRLQSMERRSSSLGACCHEGEIEKMVLEWVCKGEDVFGEFRVSNSKRLDISGIKRTLRNVRNLGANMCVIGPFTVMLK